MKLIRLKNESILDEFRDNFCEVCGMNKTDPCHIKTKGSGGHDEKSNLVSLCRKHHTEQHSLGWKKFSEKYPEIMICLLNKGWQFNSWGKLVRR